MSIFFKIIKFMFNTLINIVVILGIIIVLAWAVWDVTPQTSITKTAYFFSESWRIITGKPRQNTPFQQTTRAILKPAEEHIQRFDK